MNMFFLVAVLACIGFIVQYYDDLQQAVITPEETIVDNNFAVGDFVMFEVSNIKRSELNQSRQTVRGEVLSFGEERIEVDNLNRKNDPKARKDSQGRARRQYRFDQILGGRNNIRIAYHG